MNFDKEIVFPNKTMRIIDLLNKIANGEEVPKKIRIDHWCYKFEWKYYAGNYVDEHEDIDLMSALSCDKEELNYEVHAIEEENKIEKLYHCCMESDNEEIKFLIKNINDLSDKFNEVIDEINSIKEKIE